MRLRGSCGVPALVHAEPVRGQVPVRTSPPCPRRKNEIRAVQCYSLFRAQRGVVQAPKCSESGRRSVTSLRIAELEWGGHGLRFTAVAAMGAVDRAWQTGLPGVGLFDGIAESVGQARRE